jgi:addiction module HigA family antidote
LEENTMARPVNRMRPVHPGEVLREDYLVPLGLSVNALAVALGVPATRIHEIVKERRAVTADTACPPGAVFWRRRGVVAGHASQL